MKDDHAIDMADTLIKLMLQHQPGLLGSTHHPLLAVDSAKQVAQSLAALRAELIEQLKQQQ